MKVSAIISAYYCEQWIEGRIRNLVQQTLKPEIVVVAQEGSAEHEIADKVFSDEAIRQVLPGTMFEWNHQRTTFQLIETPDTGTIYSAWNLGIKAASGEFVTNANSDDRLAPYAIARLAQELDKRPEVGLVYADVDIVEDLSGGFESAWREGYFRWAEGGHKELLQQCFVGPQPMWRRSLHDKYGYFDAEMKSAGDYEFWLRLTSNGVKLHHLREVLGIYLRRDDQAEQRFAEIGASETLTARMRYS